MNSKEFFLSALGASVPPTTLHDNLRIQPNDQSGVECVILTDHKGHTFLRVNPWVHEESVKLF